MRQGYPRRKSAKQDAMMMPIVKNAFESGRRTFGARSIGSILLGMGIHISRRRVLRLMDAQGLYPQTAKAFRHGCTKPGKSGIRTPDLVNRKFTASAPNRMWTGDITGFLTSQGKLYVAVIEDLFSRMIVGWAMMKRKTVLLVRMALNRACAIREPITDAPIGSLDHR